MVLGSAEPPPTWALILEAAGWDPLRAQEIEKHLSQTWWARWLIEREQRIIKAKKEQGIPAEE
jgi:hypothetical protein